MKFSAIATAAAVTAAAAQTTTQTTFSETSITMRTTVLATTFEYVYVSYSSGTPYTLTSSSVVLETLEAAVPTTAPQESSSSSEEPESSLSSSAVTTTSVVPTVDHVGSTVVETVTSCEDHLCTKAGNSTKPTVYIANEAPVAQRYGVVGLAVAGAAALLL